MTTAAIPPRVQQLLEMREKGLTVTQIAARTGLKPASVSAAISRAKALQKEQREAR